MLVLYALGCERAQSPDASTPGDAGDLHLDTDQDWLCDATERSIGTDPSEADSDGDRIPDGLELQYGFLFEDREDPGLSRIVMLEAQTGSLATLDLHVVVEGAGEAFSGELSAWPGLDPAWPIAEHYFTGGIAVSAEPPDHVFGFPENGDRIGSVVGETRLGYRLTFRYSDDAPGDCAQAVIFSYAIKRQDGARFGDRVYLLVVAPDTQELHWCPAHTCL